MKVEYKHTLDDFEVIKHNKLEGYNVKNRYDESKSYHVVEYEIYLKADYFIVGNLFGLLKGELFRGAPQTRLDSIDKVNAWLEIETGVNPNLKELS